MRDGKTGVVPPDLLNSILHQFLWVRIKRTGGLVKQKDFGIPQEHSGDGDSLLLPAGQGVSSITDISLEPVWVLVDELGSVGHVCDGLQGLGVRVSSLVKTFIVLDIILDGAVEDFWLLLDETEEGSKELQVDGLDVDPVDGDDPALRVVEAEKELEKSGLARAWSANDGAVAACFEGQIEASESVGVASRESEPDVFEFDVSVERGLAATLLFFETA